ncbi:uncharacterized protein LOC117336253 [Pecten maximus]|uniref:uncharacterized protein LOC117336253 n=1 Tax=Pecten maximus TaxID=6579 RepID=UPI0014588281|nr:uncharacterized protein LOC117336253 [Pecten maximus]
MILPVIVITIATTVASKTFGKTSLNESSLAASTLVKDDFVKNSEDSISIPDVEQENICKRVVLFNTTRLITFRVDRWQKCSLSTKNCSEGGFEWIRSTGYRSLTQTQRLSELVCCEGYKNESGKCVKDLSSPTVNETSGMTEGEIIDNTTVLIIVLPVVGAVIVLVIFAVVIYKIKHSNKRPSYRPSYAHDNPVYDSSVGQSNVIVNNTCPNNELTNCAAGAEANIYEKL